MFFPLITAQATNQSKNYDKKTSRNVGFFMYGAEAAVPARRRI